MGFWEWLTGWLEWLGLKGKKGKLIFLGLDNAGKTTLMMCLKTGYFQQFDQTKTYHIEELSIEGVHFSAYDLGGHVTARECWKEYYINANGIVFFVDASDPSRFGEAKKELSSLLSDEILKNVPFLILGNKIDRDTAVSRDSLISALELYNMTPLDVAKVPQGMRPIQLFMCSVKNKSGYASGFKWLSNFI